MSLGTSAFVTWCAALADMRGGTSTSTSTTCDKRVWPCGHADASMSARSKRALRSLRHSGSQTNEYIGRRVGVRVPRSNPRPPAAHKEGAHLARTEACELDRLRSVSVGLGGGQDRPCGVLQLAPLLRGPFCVEKLLVKSNDGFPGKSGNVAQKPA